MEIEFRRRWYLKKSEFAERKRYEENSSALIDTVIGAEYSCAGTRRGKNGTEAVSYTHLTLPTNSRV